jgi:hypothetical protein
MSYLKIRTLFAASLVSAMLMALTGCGGDSREHVRRDQDRYPQRYERHDDDRRMERHDNDRHEDRDSHSGHDRDGHDRR